MDKNVQALTQSELLGFDKDSRQSEGSRNLANDAWNWVSNHKVEAAVATAGVVALAIGGTQAIRSASNWLGRTTSNDLGAATGNLTRSAYERALQQTVPGTSSKLATSIGIQPLESKLAMKPTTVLGAEQRLGRAVATDQGVLASASAAGLTTRAAVLSGDISQVKADALITPINSGGMWFGALDGVIQRSGGNQFHKQAAAAMPLADGQAVVASKLAAHKGAFDNVVFIVDDLEKPLRNVVLSGLNAAEAAGYKSVSLPAMRTGVMMGAVEKTPQATVDEMVAGVKAFMATGPKSLKDIKFVVYQNNDILARLTEGLKR